MVPTMKMVEEDSNRKPAPLGAAIIIIVILAIIAWFWLT